MSEFGVGLYMIGCFIQLSARDFVNRETGERKEKYYLMIAAGERVGGGACNVGLNADEYEALKIRRLRVGDELLVPVEVFGYKDKAYYRAVGPVQVCGHADISQEAS